eukprot:gene13208-4024_t
MNAVYLLLSCHFVAVNSVQIYRGNCRKESLFKIGGRGTRLDANIISSKTSSRLSLCAKSCIDEASCKSFNYNVVALICQLLSKDKNDVGAEKLLAVEGWNYYQPVKFMDTPRCRTETSSEKCPFNEACDEVCENPVGHKCRTLVNPLAGADWHLTSGVFWGGFVALKRPVGVVRPEDTPRCRTETSSEKCPFNEACDEVCENPVGHKCRTLGDCCGERLSNFNIRIGNSTTGMGNDNPLCAVNQGISQGATKTFLCRPRIYGRHLYVQSNIEPELCLCEVKVFGEL